MKSAIHAPTALVAAFCLAACSAPQKADGPPSGSIESAASHCVAQGGSRVAERAVDGEIGVCVFADKRQCEEWALLRGDCPPGGIQVSRYATTRERHCAIRGGRMTIPGCAFSPAGLYESARSAASGSSQRTVTLVLNAGRIAMVNITSPSGATQYLAPGHWESAGDAVTVRTDEERLVFEYAGDRLVAREWNRGIWGDGGPGTLLRKH